MATKHTDNDIWVIVSEDVYDHAHVQCAAGTPVRFGDIWFLACTGSVCSVRSKSLWGDIHRSKHPKTFRSLEALHAKYLHVSEQLIDEDQRVGMSKGEILHQKHISSLVCTDQTCQMVYKDQKMNVTQEKHPETLKTLKRIYCTTPKFQSPIMIDGRVITDPQSFACKN